MGRTESCFPGIWNAGAAELELAVSACVVPVGSLDVVVPDPSLGFPPEFAPGVGDEPAEEAVLVESAAAVADAEPADEAEPDGEEAAEEAAPEADAAPDEVAAAADDALLAGTKPDTLASGIEVSVPYKNTVRRQSPFNGISLHSAQPLVHLHLH